MIAAMLNFDKQRRSVLVVVLEKDNLERMAKADPVTLESMFHGRALKPPLYPLDFNLLIATELNHEELLRQAKGDPAEFIRWLERDRVFIEGVDGVVYTESIKRDNA